MEQDNKFIRSLIQSAQNGKVVALEELYRMNLNRIYAIALRTTANKPLAGLLTQNTFINAWQQLSRVRAEVLFADWLKSMAIYDSLKELREGKLQKDKRTLKPFSGEGKTDKLLHDPVEKAISELSDNQRVVVVLHLIENYSTPEIADLLSLSKKKTDEILTDAIKKIVEQLPDDKVETEVVDLIKNLPKEIEPHTDIIHFALEIIREAKIEEFKEAESKVEKIEKKEVLPEEEKKVEKGKVKEEKQAKKKRKTNKKNMWITLAVLLLLVISFYFLTKPKVWTITEHSGNYLLNGKVSNETELSTDEIISTTASSSALIDIPNAGKILLKPNTALKRSDKKNSAQLIKGSVEVENTGAAENFNLEIPLAAIEDYRTGNSYSVNINENESSLIKLHKGWLRVYNNIDESVFPQKFDLRVTKEQGLGVPYSTGSDSAYIAQLEEYLFNGKSLNVLGIVVSNSAVRDAVTLWNLLKRVKEMQRELVYDKLAELVPPPASSKKESLLDLNPEMMQAWLKEIEQQM